MEPNKINDASESMKELWKKRYNSQVDEDLALLEEIIKGEVIEKDVKTFAGGSSGFIPMSKKHVGKKVKIIIPKKEEDK